MFRLFFISIYGRKADHIGPKKESLQTNDTNTIKETDMFWFCRKSRHDMYINHRKP